MAKTLPKLCKPTPMLSSMPIVKRRGLAISPANPTGKPRSIPFLYAGHQKTSQYFTMSIIRTPVTAQIMILFNMLLLLIPFTVLVYGKAIDQLHQGFRIYVKLILKRVSGWIDKQTNNWLSRIIFDSGKMEDHAEFLDADDTEKIRSLPSSSSPPGPPVARPRAVDAVMGGIVKCAGGQIGDRFMEK